MPDPNTPPRSGRGLPPALAEIYQRLHAISESERMTSLVDYLEDLRREFDWAAAELKALGFCAPCYLSETGDDGDHDCVEDN